MKSIPKSLAAAGLSAAIAVPAASATVDLSGLTLAPDVETFTLDNGLDVVVVPDNRAPIVTHMVWYRVGSADEPPGKSGIAHYLEHLMFKGTEANPGSTFSTTVASLGGRENAFTSYDYTGYFQQVAREHLADMMAFEADRMEGLQLTQEVAAPELDVVLEERRARVETRPSAELGEAMEAALFVNHPYGDPVIGWPDELAALTYEDALAFYRDKYRPGNAVLVVAGDVTTEEVRELAQNTYGRIADTQGEAERRRPPTQWLEVDRLVEFADPRVTQESTQLAWLAPSYVTAEAGTGEALDILSEILGGTNTSRLYTELVRGEGAIATSAGAYYRSTALDDTEFAIYAVPREGVALTDLESRIRDIVADIAENGVTEEEVRRAKTSLLASVIFAQDSQSSLARIFGAALSTGVSVEDVQEWPSRIERVTAEDVRRAAQLYLTGRGSVTGRLLTAANTAAEAADATVESGTPSVTEDDAQTDAPE